MRRLHRLLQCTPCQEVPTNDRNVRLSLRRVIRRLKEVGLQNLSECPARRGPAVLPLLLVTIPVAGIGRLEVGRLGIAVAFGLIILVSDRVRSGRAKIVQMRCSSSNCMLSRTSRATTLSTYAQHRG